MSGRRRTIFFLVMLLAVLVLLTGQVRGEARRRETLRASKHQPPSRVVAARVVGRDPASWFATIVVDRGSADGVVRNSAVVTAEGAVGRVIETTPLRARCARPWTSAGWRKC